MARPRASGLKGVLPEILEELLAARKRCAAGEEDAAAHAQLPHKCVRPLGSLLTAPTR